MTVDVGPLTFQRVFELIVSTTVRWIAVISGRSLSLEPSSGQTLFCPIDYPGS